MQIVIADMLITSYNIALRHQQHNRQLQKNKPLKMQMSQLQWSFTVDLCYRLRICVWCWHIVAKCQNGLRYDRWMLLCTKWSLYTDIFSCQPLDLEVSLPDFNRDPIINADCLRHFICLLNTSASGALAVLDNKCTHYVLYKSTYLRYLFTKRETSLCLSRAIHVK